MNKTEMRVFLIILLLATPYLCSCKDISSLFSIPPQLEKPKMEDSNRKTIAPLTPADKRIIIVAQDGSGDYRNIQDAVDDSRPGDTIQVKNGVYVEKVSFTTSGTKQEPITLQNYPNHAPVIDPGGGAYPPANLLGGTPRIKIRAEWIIVEGFEIRYGWDGVKLYNGHNTIRNNWIHHNRYQGILIVSADDILIEGNTINNNGTDPGACFDDGWGGESPIHCHAVYMSDKYFCEGMADITIRMNTLRNHGGKGVAWNGRGCETAMTNTLVENNLIENNAWGMALYHNVENSLIRNNTFVLETHPETDESKHTFIYIRNSTDNTFENNIFYSTRDDVSGVLIRDSRATQNTFNHNLWHVQYEWWVWADDWFDDFENSYRRVTGWGDNSLCCDVDPGFQDVSKGNYSIKESSQARDKGNNESCPVFDFDLDYRADDNVCDIGMDEYL